MILPRIRPEPVAADGIAQGVGVFVALTLGKVKNKRNATTTRVSQPTLREAPRMSFCAGRGESIAKRRLAAILAPAF